ncbi:MAG: hypothetical protein ABSH22_18230, partial [Tepidisphaeraceae bacterium]
AADDLLSKAQDVDLNITRILGELRVATAQARSAQAQIASDQAYDPSTAQDQLRAKIAAAQGGAGIDVWPGPNLPPPPAEAVDLSSVAPPAAPAASEPPPAPAAPAPAPQASAPTKPAETGGGGFFASLFSGGAKQNTTAAPQTTAPADTTASAPTVTAPVVQPRPIRPEDLLTLHTLSGLDAQISAVQAKLQDNRTQAAALTAQRTSVLEQSDQLQQKSLSDQGQTSVDDVKQAAGLRRQAAELAVQVDKLDATAAQLQSDLRTSQGQRAGVQQAIDTYNHEIADLDLAWQSVKQDIESQKAAITMLAGSAGASTPAPSSTPAAGDQTNVPAPLPQPTTIADQCAELNTLIGQSRDLRDKAADQLKRAITAFNSAAKAGDDIRRSLADRLSSDRTAPTESDSLQQLIEATSGSTSRLAAAQAERALALNYSSETLISIQAKQALDAAQAALGDSAPKTIADCLQSIASPSASDLAQLAEERFQDALDHFTALTNQTSTGPGAKMRKTAALSGEMLTAFGAKQLSLALGGKPVAGGKTPQDLQTTIDNAAKDVSDQDASMLPAIPYTIAVPAPEAAPAAPPAQ